MLEFISGFPLVRWTPLAWSSDIVLALIIPVFVIMSVVYGIRAWHGEDVNIPVISDWLDDRLPA